MADIMALIAGNVVDGDLKPVADDSYNKKNIGIYFSAHWCPPCRGFTPKLIEWYNKIKEKKGDVVEIIFVSSDRTEKDFKNYFKDMPWLAIDMSNPDAKNALNKQFEVSGIPSLCFLAKDTRELITKDGRTRVLNDTELTMF